MFSNNNRIKNFSQQKHIINIQVYTMSQMKLNNFLRNHDIENNKKKGS